MIACIGIGEDHDANVLSKLSRQAHGTFEYCPDDNAITPTIGALKGAITKAAAIGIVVVIEVPRNRIPYLKKLAEGLSKSKSRNKYTKVNGLAD